MTPAPFRVARKRRETADTWTLELEPRAGGELPAFAPGQFAMLYALGAGEVPVSVSGDLTRPGPLTHTVRAVGAVSAAICDAAPGDELGVRGPFGTAWPLGEAEGRDVVLVAGGIGLAPLRPVVRQMIAHRERYGSIAILYGGRSPPELLYASELEDWRGLDLEVAVTVDSASAGWRGRVGVVTTLVARARLDARAAVAMICGPEIMMRFAITALRDRGVEASEIFVSMERSMKCAIGHCGHCQLGPAFVCKDGPVFRCETIEPLLAVREL